MWLEPLGLVFPANCQLLFAICLVFKDRPPYSFSALERIPKFTICSPLCQAKTTSGDVKPLV
jgi:hypothetical protein